MIDESSLMQWGCGEEGAVVDNVGNFSGRDDALRILDGVVAGSSAHRAVTVWGMSGQGKSRLLQHFAERERQSERSRAEGRVALVDIQDLVSCDDAAHGYGPDLATDLLREIAGHLASWHPGRRRRYLLDAYKRAESRAQRAWAAAVGVNISVSRASKMVNSPTIVNMPLPEEVFLTAYRNSLTDALCQLASADSRDALLLIDTVELLQLRDDATRHRSPQPQHSAAVGSWFTDRVIPRLLSSQPGLKVVIAGRERMPLRRVPAAQVQLVEWEIADTAAFLGSCQIDESLAEPVHRLCRGLPGWTSMAAQLIQQESIGHNPITFHWLSSTATGRVVEEWLPAIFLDRLPLHQRSVVEAAAVLRTVTKGSLSYILRRGNLLGGLPQDWFRQLLSYSSFMQRRDDGSQDYRLHGLVRSAFLAHLQRHEPERLRELHRIAGDYFKFAENFLEEAYHRFASSDDRLVDEWRERLQRALDLFQLDHGARLLDVAATPDHAERVRKWSPLVHAHVLRFSAFTHYMRNEGVQAQQLLFPALSLYEKLGDMRGQADTLRALGNVAYLCDEYAQAEKFLRSSLRLYQRLDEQLGQAWTLRAWGDVANLRGNHEQAESLLEDALWRHQELRNKHGEAETLRSLGNAVRMRGDHARAESLLQSALALHKQLNDEYGEAWTLRSLGNMARLRGAYRHAEELLKKSLALHRKLQNRHGEADTLRYLGNVAYRSRDYERAQGFLRRALALHEELQDRLGRAETLSSLGNVVRRMGDCVGAEQQLLSALSLYQDLGNYGGRAWTLRSLAGVAQARGDHARAEEYLQAAMVLFMQRDDRLGQAWTLTSLGDLARARRECGQADKLLRQALHLHQEVQDGHGQARTLASLGLLAHEQGDDVRASNLLDAANALEEG
ncbi:tetratricopeptide repeat protein [Streptomyces sp. NPDC093225]|uniref:tetratricopeptide repeat protein n=1 Tax=Streptomyces sp. NPDC093225 TaxID=3366034 RepID=UPI00380EBBD4